MQAWQSFKAQQCREAQGANVHTHLLSPYKDSNKENQIQLSKYPNTFSSIENQQIGHLMYGHISALRGRRLGRKGGQKGKHRWS